MANRTRVGGRGNSTPTALKILEGNPGKRPLPKNEPQPRTGEPALPEWLDAEAKKEWRRVVPILLRVGLLTEADGSALATYCEIYSTYLQASQILQENGFTFMNHTSGVEHPRPEVAIVQQCRTHIRQFCSEFGLTPSSRSRMTTAGPADVDGMASFLG